MLYYLLMHYTKLNESNKISKEIMKNQVFVNTYLCFFLLFFVRLVFVFKEFPLLNCFVLCVSIVYVLLSFVVRTVIVI